MWKFTPRIKYQMRTIFIQKDLPEIARVVPGNQRSGKLSARMSTYDIGSLPAVD